MRRAFLFFSTLLIWVGSAAQEVVPANTVFDILARPVALESAGMAGAGSAVSSFSGAFASFSNPAVLPFAVKKMDAAVSYGLWAPAFSLSKGNNFSGAVAFRASESFVLNAGAAFQLHPEQDFGTYGKYSPKDLMVSLGAALSIGEYVSVAVSGRLVNQSFLADYSISGVAFTGMAQFHKDGLDIAAGVANFGPGVKAEDGSVSALPASARLAASYALPFGLGFAADADYYFSGKFGVSGGAYYSFKDMVFARVGYRFATEGAPLPSHLSVGIGGRFRGFTLDIAYLTLNPQIGNSLSVALGYRF
ncbi:MAG: hypothetical protein IK113_04525 [Bacteroidales bacterium]|nr:hypothetical protein [Bacteroidales bacterium]